MLTYLIYKKKIARGTGQDWKVAIVDATKILVQRPPKNKIEDKLQWQEKPYAVIFYAIINCKIQKVLSLSTCKGSKYGFELFK